MTTTHAVSSGVGEMLAALEADLHLVVEGVPAPRYGAVRDMIAYHLGWTEASDAARGKRVRPLLTILTCAAAGGDWRQALPAASSVELIHNFSLIHDDIQDRSQTRRGRPTVWKKWGVAQAINTGDTLFVLARLAGRRLLEAGVAAGQALQVQQKLDEACLALTLGQHLDLAFEAAEEVSEDDYLEMVGGKTAALLEAACDVGAQIAASPAQSAYRQFGRQVGLAFQILDDILGVWGESDVTGKPAGDDLADRKKTFPVVFGLARSEEFRRLWRSGGDSPAQRHAMAEALTACGARDRARDLARSLTDDALASLRQAAPAGEAGFELHALSERLLQRRH